MEREELRLMAGRLELPELERLLTPPSDILGHYNDDDKGIKEREDDAIRHIALSSLGEAAAAATLIDPFSPAAHNRFHAKPSASIAYPLLFTHVYHPTISRPPILESLIEDSIEEFQANLGVFTWDALEGLDWSNVVLAGGAALNCLLKVPPEHRADRGKWPGPDRTVAKERLEPEDDDDQRVARGGEKRTVRAKGGYGSSDVGFFIMGLTPAAATEKLNAVVRHICGKLMEDDVEDDEFNLLVVRTAAAVTIWTAEPAPNFQVVLCCYSGPADVVLHFDLDCCGVMYDGAGVRVTERARRAITHRMNLVEPTKLSPTLESRLLKYAFRGFRVAVPGFAPELVDPAIYDTPLKDLIGLAWLLARHKLSLDRHLEFNHLERQKKRKKNQNGTFVDTPGDAPDLEDEELRLPLAPCGADIGSDTRALLPQNMVPPSMRRPYLLALSRELQSASKPQCFVFASWWMFGFDSLFINNVRGLEGREPLLSVPETLTWRVGWEQTADGLSSGCFHPVTAPWTAQAYLGQR